eukprot:g3546.t1
MKAGLHSVQAGVHTSHKTLVNAQKKGLNNMKAGLHNVQAGVHNITSHKSLVNAQKKGLNKMKDGLHNVQAGVHNLRTRVNNVEHSLEAGVMNSVSTVQHGLERVNPFSLGPTAEDQQFLDVGKIGTASLLDFEAEASGNTRDRLRYSYALLLNCKPKNGRNSFSLKSIAPETTKQDNGSVEGGGANQDIHNEDTAGRHDTVYIDHATVEEQLVVLQALCRTGLTVALLEKTEETANILTVLVSATSRNGNKRIDHRKILAHERSRIARKRFINHGMMDSDGTFQGNENLPYSVAEELRHTDTIIRRTLGTSLGDEADVLAHSCPMLGIRSMFPLHDMVYNRWIQHKYMSNKCTLSPTVARARADWLVDELRNQFGERVALYFAYVLFYTAHILPVAIAGALLWILSWIDWNLYVMLLALGGILMACVWGPLLRQYWTRYCILLCHRWGLPREGVNEEHPNPYEPYFELRPNVELGGQLERVYDPNNNRAKVLMYMPFIMLVNVLFLFVSFGPFMQWYVYAKMAPSCDCCNWLKDSIVPGFVNGTFTMESDILLEAIDPVAAETAKISGNLSTYTGGWQPYIYPEEKVSGCTLSRWFDYTNFPESCSSWETCFASENVLLFVTDRWYYVLIQGILLGILLDVVQFNAFVLLTEVLTKYENWDSEATYDNALARKQFFFLWVNMYVWFWGLGLIYVPYGPHICEWLIENGNAKENE